MYQRSKRSSKRHAPAEYEAVAPEWSAEYQQSLSYDQLQTYTHEKEYDYDREQEINQPELAASEYIYEDDKELDSVVPQMAALKPFSDHLSDQGDDGYYQEPSGRVLVRTTDPNTSTEPIDKRYKVRKGEKFLVGSVFQLLWTTPSLKSLNQTDKNSLDDIEIILGQREEVKNKYGEECYVIVRQFVIVNEGVGSCVCLPITTYLGQATNRKGVHRSEHAIIYDKQPIPLADEKLTKMPIKFLPSSPQHKLSRASRINYGRLYVVEHNVKVWFIGEIDSESIKVLKADYKLEHTPPRPVPQEDHSTQHSLSTPQNSYYIKEESSSMASYSSQPISQSLSNGNQNDFLSKRSYSHPPHIPQGSAYYCLLTDQYGRQVRQYGARDPSAEDVAKTEYEQEIPTT